MIINMKTISGGEILAGAVNGKMVFATSVSDTSVEPEGPVALFMDFEGVVCATASFLRETVIALKAYKRNIGSMYYPVVCNINDDIVDEIVVLTESRKDAIIACDRTVDGTVTNVRMIGELDPKQAMTFEFVRELNTTDARSLMKKFGEVEKTTSTTAWNNRLSSLVARGVVREFSHGRAKFYKPLFDEVK